VILDGGHNAAAGEALAAELTRRAVLDDRPVHAICGLLTSKAATDFLTPLAPHVASLTTIAIPGEENSFTAEALREVALGAGHADVVAAPDLDTAVARLAAARPPERLLICGSLYLAGHVLRSNG
jgi:dihydrofolate synthase/folylpolyglutamate synthase